MSLKGVSYKRLYSHEDRSIAHLAARARVDTIHGGCRALMIADRLHRMGTRLDPSPKQVVTDVYSASTGNWHTQHEGWECPECGQAYLGQEQALKCCDPNEHHDC